MATAEEPLAPQKDLTSQELASGYGYGPLVSYVNGICNPAGRRSGTQFTVTTSAGLTSALASCTYGDDIVVTAGITISSPAGWWEFPSMGTPSATTPKQPPARMTTYVQTNSVSDAGVILGGPTPISPSKMTSVSKMSTPGRMASVILQGDPSYVRIMSSEAHLITAPPPHDQWHVTNYAHFAHLDQGFGGAGNQVLSTPDQRTNYAGYEYFRMEGLHIINHAANGFGGFVTIGPANSAIFNGPWLAPHHYIFDRCYLDGDRCGAGVIPTGDGSNRGIAGGCDFFGFLNGRVSGVWRTAAGDYNLESNAFSFSFGLGPIHIENNWLNGAGECTLMNGGPVSGTFPYPYIVSDCTFLRNWCLRPLKWRESFHWNAIPPNQTGECTFSIDAGGTVVTAAFGGIGGRLFFYDGDEFVPGDYFWTATSGRPVRIQVLNSQLTLTLGSAYTENAGSSGLRCVFAKGRMMMDGMDAKKVTLSGSGNRTVTGTGTSWLTTVKPYVDTPPPGCGVFFGVNTNLVSGTPTVNNQKQFPVLKQILSVDSDTQMTLAEDFTAGTFSNVYYSVTLWDGKVRSVMKNLHEWKASNRIRVIGNVLENAWATFNGQGANVIALNAGNGNFGYHRDDYFGYNLIVNGSQVQYCVGYPWTNGAYPGDLALGPTRRVCFEHTLATDMFNYQWYADHLAMGGINVLPNSLNPGGFVGPDGGASGLNDFQCRHNTLVLSTDYQPYLQLFYPSVQALPQTQHQRMVFRDNIAYTGLHSNILATLSAGFLGGGNNSAAHADLDDADALLAGTGFGGSGQPIASSDSVFAHNVFMRGSAATIAAHTVNYGGGNAGMADEIGVGFSGFGTSAHTPHWLTQSTTPSDYALTALYTTSPGVCTVSGATVTISVGSFPAGVAAGTPFIVQGDSYLYMTRVLTRDSGSQLTLVSTYPGTTGTGLTATLGFIGAGSDGSAGTVFTTSAGDATVTTISSKSFSESFTHADENSLASIDQPWTQVSGTDWGIRSNTARITAANAGTAQTAVCQTSLLGVDHSAQMTISSWGLVSNEQIGLMCRSDASGTNAYRFLAVPALGPSVLWRIDKKVGGTITTLATYNGVAPAAGQVLYFEVTGSTLTAKIDGSTVMSTTDSSLTTGTYVGFVGLLTNGIGAVGCDGFSATTTTALAVTQVALSTGTWPGTVVSSTLFPRTFLVSGDAAANALSVSSRDSSTLISLTGIYAGTTGAGLTGVVSGTIPSGVNPGANTTALQALVGTLRT